MYDPLSQKNCGSIFIPFTFSVFDFSDESAAPPRKKTVYSELFGKLGAPLYPPLLFIIFSPVFSLIMYSHFKVSVYTRLRESSHIFLTSFSINSSSNANLLKPSKTVFEGFVLSYSQKMGNKKLCSLKYVYTSDSSNSTSRSNHSSKSTEESFISSVLFQLGVIVIVFAIIPAFWKSRIWLRRLQPAPNILSIHLEAKSLVEISKSIPRSSLSSAKVLPPYV